MLYFHLYPIFFGVKHRIIVSSFFVYSVLYRLDNKTGISFVNDQRQILPIFWNKLYSFWTTYLVFQLLRWVCDSLHAYVRDDKERFTHCAPCLHTYGYLPVYTELRFSFVIIQLFSIGVVRVVYVLHTHQYMIRHTTNNINPNIKLVISTIKHTRLTCAARNSKPSTHINTHHWIGINNNTKLDPQ